MEYESIALLYDRVIMDRQISVKKSDTTWSWLLFNMPCKSLKSILVLFKEKQLYKQDTSRFYNLKVPEVSIIIKSKPNQLYTQAT